MDSLLVLDSTAEITSAQSIQKLLGPEFELLLESATKLWSDLPVLADFKYGACRKLPSIPEHPDEC